MSDTQTRLLELLDRAYADQQAFVAALSEADRAAVGTRERWTIKDAISHIALWQQVAVERVAAICRGEEPLDTKDYQAINDAHFEAYRDRSWAATSAEAEAAYRALAAQTAALSEEDLTDPQRFAHAHGRTLAQLIMNNGGWHPEAHLAQFYVDRGELERANRLQEEVTALLEASLEDRHVARYNLACYYAQSGQPARALTELARALKLNPDLIEWSKQDADLDSLRDDPAYQALYQSA
jgi:tetratricopeptide (TPR) repeat protein